MAKMELTLDLSKGVKVANALREFDIEPVAPKQIDQALQILVRDRMKAALKQVFNKSKPSRLLGRHLTLRDFVNMGDSVRIDLQEEEGVSLDLLRFAISKGLVDLKIKKTGGVATIIGSVPKPALTSAGVFIDMKDVLRARVTPTKFEIRLSNPQPAVSPENIAGFVREGRNRYAMRQEVIGRKTDARKIALKALGKFKTRAKFFNMEPEDIGYAVSNAPGSDHWIASAEVTVIPQEVFNRIEMRPLEAIILRKDIVSGEQEAEDRMVAAVAKKDRAKAQRKETLRKETEYLDAMEKNTAEMAAIQKAIQAGDEAAFQRLTGRSLSSVSRETRTQADVEFPKKIGGFTLARTQGKKAARQSLYTLNFQAKGSERDAESEAANWELGLIRRLDAAGLEKVRTVTNIKPATSGAHDFDGTINVVVKPSSKLREELVGAYD